MTQLKTMDLPDQVKALLINGKIVASVLNPLILSAGCIKYWALKHKECKQDIR